MQLLQVRTCSNPTTFPSSFVAQHKMPMRHNPNQQQHMNWLSSHEGPKTPSHMHAFGVSGTAATAAYAHTYTQGLGHRAIQAALLLLQELYRHTHASTAVGQLQLCLPAG